jgi:hypothetical protein
MKALTLILGWLADPRNRAVQAFLLIAVLFLLLCRQCNVSSCLEEEVKAAKAEIERNSQNHAAELDTLKQTHDAEKKTLTAEIAGYRITQEELNTKYAKLFQDYLKEKGKKPITITEIRYRVRENIVGVDVDAVPVDSMGNGAFSFCDSITFSPGNSRTLSGNFPYKVAAYLKKDSSLLDYRKQNFYVYNKPGKANFTLEQEIAVNTGLSRDEKTREVKVWAKTSYPGVTFTVLKGASVEEDEETRKTLESLRKVWGVGFSVGAGAVYAGKTLSPGLFMGASLNYSPRKLQFGK